MPVLVAVPDSQEGPTALTAAAAEAQCLGTNLIVVNLALRTDGNQPSIPDDLPVTFVDRKGPTDRDPVDAVLDEIIEHRVDRLVIGLRRRSPVGKALLGSVSQRLLLESPVPVLAVKAAETGADADQ